MEEPSEGCCRENPETLSETSACDCCWWCVSEDKDGVPRGVEKDPESDVFSEIGCSLDKGYTGKELRRVRRPIPRVPGARKRTGAMLWGPIRAGGETLCLRP